MSDNTNTGESGQGHTPPVNGTMCWLEIPATDIPRVAAFYNAVLGWTCLQATEEQGTPSPQDPKVTVHMFTHAGTLNGAFLHQPSGSSITDNTKAASVIATFKVEDVAEALAKVEEKGGKIHL